MKFCDMPYERVDFEKAKEELLGLMNRGKTCQLFNEGSTLLFCQKPAGLDGVDEQL